MIECDGFVNVCMSLCENVDLEEVKTILARLATGGKLEIEVNDFRHSKIILLVCRIDQKTFETAFNAKVEWREITIPNLNHGPSQVYDWFEHRAPEIPKVLKGKIKYIELDKPMYLTD